MNKVKRFLALFLTLCLMLSCVPFGAMATEPTQTTGPAGTTAATDAPEGTTAPAETTVPETTVPETTVPETTVPETTVPETTVPETTVPETTVPETTVPETTVPATSEPEILFAVPFASLRASYADFYRVFHMDVGRKYFTVDQVKEIIDVLAASNYTHLELAIGNDALRLILDNMSLTVGDNTYTHDQIANGIKQGNVNYSHSGEWTQAEMDTIMAYADSKNIEIIPLVNTPGHMDAILDAMESVGISGAYNGSARTVDVTNATAVAFTQALVNKYIQYFASMGCTVFHMGADEYANDIYTSGSMGFGQLQTAGHYDEFAKYVNDMASLIKAAGMIPAAFNDGLYFNNNTTSSFDSDILVTYWSSGWGTYTVASASSLAGKGHKILNTNDGWYYVLGRNSGNTYSYTTASSNVVSTSVTDVPGSSDPSVVGAMICLWCDTPSADYSANKDKVIYLIETLAANNEDYFVAAEPDVPETTVPETTVPGTSEPTTPDSGEVTEGDVTITAEGVTAAEVAELEGFENKPEDVTAYVGYSIKLNGGEYTGPATVKVPYDAELFKGCSEFGLVVDGETFYGNNEAGEPYVKVEGESFILNVPHFSDVYVVGRIVTKEETITVAAGQDNTVKIEGVDYSGNVDKSELDETIATVEVTKQTSEGSTYWELVTNGAAGIEEGAEYIIAPASSGSVRLLSRTGGRSNNITVSDSKINSTIESSYIFTFEQNGSGWNIKDSSGKFLYPDASISFMGWNYSLSTEQSTPQAVTINGNSHVTIYRSVSNYNLSTTSYIRYNNGYDGDDNSSNLHLFKKVTEPAGEYTEITFSGKAVGTTYVTIGDTRYTINVIDAPPSDALTSTALTVEQWITNIHAGTESASGDWDFTINSSDANTEAGVEIATLAPATAYWAYSDLYYWQTVRLDADNYQTQDGGDDETADGTPFTHVRYYNGAWQYKDISGVWHYFLEDDQVVAYYLQKIDVTDEVDTYFKDWGYDTSSTTEDSSSNKGQVALTVAVVYPDGTVSPAEGEMYAKSTTIFNYWQNRDIGIVAPANNSDYDISKITVTYGNRDNNTSANVWYTTDTITWNKVTNDAGSEWFDETVYWDKETNAGTVPMVNGAVSGITWGEKNDAILVLIYLETKVTEDSLTVNWVDDSANGALIHTMPVNLTITGDETKTFFTELKQKSPIPEEDVGGTFTLDDDAYVVNTSGVNQTFNKDISVIPTVAQQYRSGLYKYVSADISADGRTLTLHYNIDASRLSPLYVVDFGLPVEFPVKELVNNPDDVAKIEIYPTSNYGTAVLNGISVTDGIVTYTPTAVLENIDVLKFDVTFKDNTKQTFRMGFVPASTVYYEEGFVETWTGNWSGSKSSTKQETQVAQFTVDGKTTTGDDTPNYGYTSALANTINSNYANSTTGGDKAQFSFSGTGIDIYANCDTNTSIVAVMLYQGGSLKKFYQVNTANANGTTVATDNQAVDGTIGLPIVSIHDLPYGSYDVVIQHTSNTSKAFKLDGFRVYNTLGTTSSANQYYPASEQYPTFVELREHTLEAYDVNTNVEFPATSAKAVTDQIFGEHGTSAGAIVLNATNGVESANAQDLLVNGPKNELYLWPGETVVFTLNDGLSAQIGMKALTGAATAKVNGTSIAVNSTVDMFYNANTSGEISANFSGEITIENAGSTVLSITKLKVFGATSENVFAAVEQAPVAYTVMRMMRVSEPDVEDTTPTEPVTPSEPVVPSEPVTPSEPVEPSEPETPVEPEVVYADASVKIKLVDYAGKSVANASVTANGISGGACTFTAADILAAVKDNLPAGYAIVDENSVSDLEMTYGGTASMTVKVGKIATVKVTYVSIFGRKMGTEVITVVQTSASNYAYVSASAIRDAAPAHRTAVWLTNVRVRFGSSANVIVPCI